MKKFPHEQRGRTFSHFVQTARSQPFQCLHASAGPSNLDELGMRGAPEMESLRMLRQVAGTSGEPLGLAIHAHASANGVAIGLSTNQAEGDSRAALPAAILENAQLGTQSTFYE